MTKTKRGKNKNYSKRLPGSLSQEDQALWAHVTCNVTPLSGRKASFPNSSGQKDSDRKPPFVEGAHRSIQLPKTTAQRRLYSHGQAPGLDKRTQMRLKRGQVAIEGRLDLHGMNQAEAYSRLSRFLEVARNNGSRTVLVITGKGLRRDGQIGVLRSTVPRWLNEPPLRDWIKAFDHASPRDGGKGALYILLRRRK